MQCVATGAVEGVDGWGLGAVGGARLANAGAAGALLIPESDGIIDPTLGDSASAEAEAVGKAVVGVELGGDAEGGERFEAAP